MPSFNKDKGGKLKLIEKTDNPDQAIELAKAAVKPTPTKNLETETK